MTAPKAPSPPQRVAGPRVAQRAAGSQQPGPRDGRRHGGGDTPSFEQLLSRVLAGLPSAAVTAAGVREALERVARYFAVDRAEVAPAGGGAAPAADPRPAGGSRLDVPIAVGGGEIAGTISLWARDEGRAWSERDAEQARIVGSIVLGALRLRHVEFERRERELWLWLALEKVEIGVWDWHLASDRVRYITPFFHSRGSFEVRETSAASWSQTTHPQDVAAARAEVARAVTGESETFGMVVRSRQPQYRGGDWFSLSSRGRVIARDANGRATRIIGMHEDVTEALRQAEHDQQREAALANASRLAALGALASSLAHEINQPLAALTSFLDAAVRLLAAGDAQRPEVERALERSVALAGRASEIVGRLRRLLRREPPLKEPVGLAAALRSVRDQLGRECRAAAVEVRIADERATATIPADRVQLEQALVNLVRNAVEALATGKREPRVVTLSASVAGDTAEIRVTDNGPGIADADVGHVLEPFFTTKSWGTGLGLVIVESIAEVHGGRLRLDSTGPEGTTFVLELPARAGGVR